MSSLETVSNYVTGSISTVALLAGIVPASYGVVHYWRVGETTLFPPLIAVGLMVGFVCHWRDIAARDAGLQTGIVASVAFLGPVLDVLVHVFGLVQPPWATGIQVAMLAMMAGIIVAVSGLIGMLGAILGDGLARKMGRIGPLVARQ